jgi:hypothetical protein
VHRYFWLNPELECMIIMIGYTIITRWKKMGHSCHCYYDCHGTSFEGVSKIFRTDIEIFINLTTKCVWKLPTSTQLRATWHTDSLDMVILPSTGALRNHKCCIVGGSSLEYFGSTLIYIYSLFDCSTNKSYCILDTTRLFRIAVS